MDNLQYESIKEENKFLTAQLVKMTRQIEDVIKERDQVVEQSQHSVESYKQQAFAAQEALERWRKGQMEIEKERKTIENEYKKKFSQHRHYEMKKVNELYRYIGENVVDNAINNVADLYKFIANNFAF
jgi:hypothetical protein